MNNFSFLVRHLFFNFDSDLIAVIVMRQHATFHQRRITRGGDMTSYRFSYVD